MKFVYTLLSFAAAALAQRIEIGSPASGAQIFAGLSTVVSVVKPNTLTGSTEVGIGITIHHCNQSPCEDASEQLGTILYAGSYEPAYTSSTSQPQQNFVVTIPSSFPAGDAVLSVVHSNLVGAGPFFFTEIANETVSIVNDDSFTYRPRRRAL